jgi:pyrroline-5-carboxylate reductase
MDKIACIGSGNMGLALMKGASSVVGGANIFFADADAEKARMAAASLGAGVYNSNVDAVGNGEFVFLAVKPQVLPQVLAEIAPLAKKRFDPR